MTTPVQAFETGEALALNAGPDNVRPIAALWMDGEDLLFADIGWPENDSGHPFHRLAGPVTGGGPWYAGGHEIGYLFPWEPERAEYVAWLEAAAGRENWSPAAARAAAEADGI